MFQEDGKPGRKNTAARCLTFFHQTDSDPTFSNPKVAKEDSLGWLTHPADQIDPLTTPGNYPGPFERGISCELHYQKMARRSTFFSTGPETPLSDQKKLRGSSSTKRDLTKTSLVHMSHCSPRPGTPLPHQNHGMALYGRSCHNKLLAKEMGSISHRQE